MNATQPASPPPRKIRVAFVSSEFHMVVPVLPHLSQLLQNGLGPLFETFVYFVPPHQAR